MRRNLMVTLVGNLESFDQVNFLSFLSFFFADFSSFLVGLGRDFRIEKRGRKLATSTLESSLFE